MSSFLTATRKVVSGKQRKQETFNARVVTLLKNLNDFEWMQWVRLSVKYILHLLQYCLTEMLFCRQLRVPGCIDGLRRCFNTDEGVSDER